jgi:hypothetical protein
MLHQACRGVARPLAFKNFGAIRALQIRSEPERSQLTEEIRERGPQVDEEVVGPRSHRGRLGHSHSTLAAPRTHFMASASGLTTISKSTPSSSVAGSASVSADDKIIGFSAP